MNAFAPKLLGEKKIGQVMYWIRQMLKPHGVKVCKFIDKSNTALSSYTIGGFYDPSVERGECDIEMFVVFNESEKNDTFFFDSVGLELLINELFTCLVHEKRHRYQFKKRGNAYGPQYRTNVHDAELKVDLEYYGDPDEIDAYAQEAVIEERLYKRPATITDKYRDLFSSYDPKVYHRFLKKKYKFDQKVSL